MDYKKLDAVLVILQDFIDFINKQVGVYCDCLSSFIGNKVRVERQKARVNYPTSKSIKNGQPTVMWSSYEDPNSPDVLHHRIIKVDDFISVNSEKGFNEQQITWAIIVFIFAHWDEEIRPKIAKIRNTEPNNIRVNEFGDLRILRKSIIHNSGILTQTEYDKLTTLKDLVTPNCKITLSHDQMHKLFIHMKQGIARIAFEYTGNLPGTPDISKITGIAIQTINKIADNK